MQSGRHDAAFYGALWRDLQTHGHWQGEVWNQRKSGEVYAQRLAISAVHDAHGRTERYVGLLTDITALKNHQTQLEFMAHYDALNPPALRRLLAAGVKLSSFPNTIVNGAYKVALDLYAELSAKNPEFKKMYESQRAFQAQASVWNQVSAYAYDTAIIRELRR